MALIVILFELGCAKCSSIMSGLAPICIISYVIISIFSTQMNRSPQMELYDEQKKRSTSDGNDATNDEYDESDENEDEKGCNKTRRRQRVIQGYNDDWPSYDYDDDDEDYDDANS